MTRPDWDEYFLGIAASVAARADCTRRAVGCVIVDVDRRVLGTGYNGSPPGGPSCLAGECPRGQQTYDEVPAFSNYDSCIAVHAEANALLFARASCKGATAYVTTAPCPSCAKLLAGAGVVRTVSPRLTAEAVAPAGTSRTYRWALGPGGYATHLVRATSRGYESVCSYRVSVGPSYVVHPLSSKHRAPAPWCIRCRQFVPKEYL